MRSKRSKENIKKHQKIDEENRLIWEKVR